MTWKSLKKGYRYSVIMGKFYAIKVGKGVNNIIVKSWWKCQKYVLDFPSIYESFKTEKNAKKYLEKMDNLKFARRLELSKILKIRNLKRKLQKKYTFIIPDYILQEVASNNSCKKEIINLIDFAVAYEHISFKNSLILKKELLK